MPKIYILVVLICANLFGFSQVPNHISLGKEQFANTDVYGIIYSKKHELIVTTNKGVWKYGYSKEKEGFNKFPTLPEQRSNSFFDLKMSQKGVIYCKNLKNQIFKINDNAIELYYELSDKDKCNEFYYFIDPNEDLIIFGKRIIKVDKSRKTTVLFDPKVNPDDWPDPIFYKVNQSQDGTISSIGMHEKLFYVISYASGKVSSSKLTSMKWNDDESLHLNSKIDRFNIGNDTIFLSERMSFGGIDELPHVDIKPNGIERFHQLDNAIIGLHESKGYRIFSSQNDTLITSASIFPNTFISTVFLDNQGTLFLGTFGEGVIVVPKTNSLQYTTNNLISDFDVLPDNTAYLSTREGKVLKFDGHTFKEELSVNTNIDFIVSNPYKYNFTKKPFFTDVIPNLFGLSRCKDAYPTQKGIYAATNNGIKFIANNPNKSVLPAYFKKDHTVSPFIYQVYGERRFNRITVDEDTETIYFANDEDLFKMTPQGTVSKLTAKGESIRCTDILMWNKQLIVATPNQGLLFYKDGKFQGSLSQNTVNASYIEKIDVLNNEIFIQTDKGIQIAQLPTGDMKYLGFKEGLTSNLINDFALTNDKIWIQEKHKIYAINLADINVKEEPINFHIDSILTTRNKHAVEKDFELSHNDRSLRVFLNYRDILRIGEAYYEYRINQSNWKSISAKQGELELNNLTLGEYDLEIRLHYRNGVSPIKYIHFLIKPAIWMRWWFYPLIVIILLSFIVLFYRRKLKKQAEHSRHMNELNASKMTALQSQMNPHFIFNALNSIQHLVIRGNKEEAYKYITQFANLVRRTLEYSEQETISVVHEMNLLEVYLELEKLRFKEDFDYTIEKKNFRDVRIPPMLIQPFIENALLHGLLHKEGEKRLKLMLEITETTLICLIEDNGIGREQSKRIRERQRGTHKSFALNALDNRFRILRESYHTDIGYEYEDFNPNKNLATVTRVRLKIPIQ